LKLTNAKEVLLPLFEVPLNVPGTDDGIVHKIVGFAGLLKFVLSHPFVVKSAVVPSNPYI
jgi:hypothetical protein